MKKLEEIAKNLEEYAKYLKDENFKCCHVGTLSEEELELQSLRAELAYVKTELEAAINSSRVKELELVKVNAALDIYRKRNDDLHDSVDSWQRSYHEERIRNLEKRLAIDCATDALADIYSDIPFYLTNIRRRIHDVIQKLEDAYNKQ